MTGRGSSRRLTEVQLARVDVVLHAALEHGARERSGFVRDLCAGDEAVCDEVLGILEWVGEDEGRDVADVAAVPADEVASAEGGMGTPGLRPGERVGRYRILQQIGEGGFAVVYLAEQESPVRRRVALKIVKAGMDTEEVISRFSAERQVLALMDHPNVANVFDGGSAETGRPFFVMEYVAGIPITEHCDRQRLTVEERLALFMEVCDAVTHAHQKGIIHRDLKPSNVLVTIKDGKAVPKIIDFGVAKALDRRLTERTIFTEQGQIIGTPEYMSPEQAEMTAQDIDTRSDIYSLGVLLYELLTGTLPFERKAFRRSSFVEIQRIIREQEPPKPSTRFRALAESSTSSADRRRVDPRSLLHKLRDDLDWIVMKALEKDRGRRYETAHALARDIRRHLDHEPVLAGPPSAAYKLTKFVRRNRAGVTAGSIAVLSLGAAASLSVALLKQDSAETLGLYQKAFSQSSNAMMTIELPTLRFTEANQRALDLFGYTEEEFLDLTVVDLSADPNEMKEAVERIASGKLTRLERRKKRSDGTEFWAEIHAGRFTWEGRTMLLWVLHPLRETSPSEHGH